MRSESIWVDAEFYFYGKITNMGGKNKANIHISTEVYGSLIVDIQVSYKEQFGMFNF